MLIDSHCHLDYPGLAEDLPGVMARAEAAGIGAVITISTRVRQFDRLKAIVADWPQVFCSIGTHPHNAAEEKDVGPDELARLAAHPKVVAIGEAGLDYHYQTSPIADQERGFRTHIEAARATGLPLVIHARDADDHMAAILQDEMARGAFSAVLHCYTSGEALARLGLELGLYISFSGVLTFKKSDSLRAIAARVPLERLLVETDAPFLAPEPVRGRSNEPAFVRHTARVLAAVKGVSEAEIAAATTENALRLFGRIPRSALVVRSSAA